MEPQAQELRRKMESDRGSEIGGWGRTRERGREVEGAVRGKFKRAREQKHECCKNIGFSRGKWACGVGLGRRGKR